MQEEELKYVPVLICANKQDSIHAISVNEIIREMNLNSIKDRNWKVQSTSAIKEKCICEGLDWIGGELSK